MDNSWTSLGIKQAKSCLLKPGASLSLNGRGLLFHLVVLLLKLRGMELILHNVLNQAVGWKKGKQNKIKKYISGNIKSTVTVSSNRGLSEGELHSSCAGH